MLPAFDCALNGVALSSLDSRLCVLDIRQDAPKHRAMQSFSGQRMRRPERDSLTLHIDLVLHEEEPIRRQALLSAVHAWAVGGGWLTCSERPGQRLSVVCTGLAAISAADWTEKMTLTFQSDGAPYWEDEAATTVSGSGAMVLALPGTAEAAPVDVTLVHQGGSAVTAVTISVGDTLLRFEGLAWQSGSRFQLTQAGGLLRAEIDGQSVLPHRTVDSADMLLARCGADNTVQATADRSLTATFSARGRYV